MATTIKLKNGTGAPSAGALVVAEPALDLTNKRLYTEDSGGTVIEVGTNPTSVTTGDITATGTATFAGLTTTADVSFGDNDKAIFGAGSDLQIYHDGSSSYIVDNGTGNLQIDASDFRVRKPDGSEAMIHANADGAVKLFYDGGATPKLATTSSGIDVTGTIVGDGLTVDGNIQVNGTNAGQLTLDATGQYTQVIFEQNGSSNSGGDILYDHTNDIYALRGLAVGDMRFKTSAVAGTALNRQNIASNGDISFYNSAGTSQDLFWDASTSRLGLGTTSPAAPLSIAGSSTGEYDALILRNGNSAASGQSTAIIFEASAGTSGDEAASVAKISGLRTGAGSKGDLLFHTTLAGVSSEAMRIDSSGNLLVGTTDSSPFDNSANSSADNGIALRSDGILAVAAYKSTANSGNVVTANRTGTDGPIIGLQKSGSTVGSIGTNSNKMYLGTGSANIRFRDDLAAIVPTDSDGSNSDADLDLGYSTIRWRDLYLSGGAYLGGTGSANKLDDYEEGTFTARLRGSTAEPATLLTATAQYQVVGHRVFVSIAFENVNTTGYSGDITVDQLPFSCAETRAVLTVSSYAGGVWTDQPIGSLATGDSTVYWQDAKTASIWGNVSHNAAGGARYFWVQGFYKIS